MGRRRIDGHGITDELVQHAGLNAHGLLVSHILYQLRDAVDALPGQGGGVQHRRILQEADFIPQILRKAQGGLVILVREHIPLIDNDNDALA